MVINNIQNLFMVRHQWLDVVAASGSPAIHGGPVPSHTDPVELPADLAIGQSRVALSLRPSDQLARAPLRGNQCIAIGGEKAGEPIALAVIARGCRRRLGLLVMFLPDGVVQNATYRPRSSSRLLLSIP